MHSRSLIELALKTLSCSQKDLASQLGVSQTQITKWKKGEHMSHEMQEKLRTMVNINDEDPDLILWAGSIEEVEKWKNLIIFLADMANDNGETCYITHPLTDELDFLCWNILNVMKEIGVDLPSKVPAELDFDYDSADDEQLSFLLGENPYSKIIYDVFESFTDIYGFYAAYIDEFFFDDDLDLMNTEAENIEPCLLQLAACKLEDDDELMPKLKEFRLRTLNSYRKWIGIVKDKAFRAGAPLRAELMDLVTRDREEIGETAEAEGLGFNSMRLHPDVYMNEILCSLRALHQVLPAILKKLEIDFKLDDSEFFIE